MQGVSALYYLFFFLTGMKNFIMNVSGIFPYTLYIYLKTCLKKPGEAVNHWFLPCPVNRWVMGMLVAVTLTLTVPETQGCIVVFFHYLFSSFLVFLKHISKKRCFYFEGPTCKKLLILFERLIPQCIKNIDSFCSYTESVQAQEAE